MYTFIVNPLNNQEIDINSKKGISIIKNYLKQLLGGAEAAKPDFIQDLEKLEKSRIVLIVKKILNRNLSTEDSNRYSYYISQKLHLIVHSIQDKINLSISNQKHIEWSEEEILLIKTLNISEQVKNLIQYRKLLYQCVKNGMNKMDVSMIKKEYLVQIDGIRNNMTNKMPLLLSRSQSTFLQKITPALKDDVEKFIIDKRSKIPIPELYKDILLEGHLKYNELGELFDKLPHARFALQINNKLGSHKSLNEREISFIKKLQFQDKIIDIINQLKKGTKPEPIISFAAEFETFNLLTMKKYQISPSDIEILKQIIFMGKIPKEQIPHIHALILLSMGIRKKLEGIHRGEQHPLNQEEISLIKNIGIEQNIRELIRSSKQ